MIPLNTSRLVVVFDLYLQFLEENKNKNMYTARCVHQNRKNSYGEAFPQIHRESEKICWKFCQT